MDDLSWGRTLYRYRSGPALEAASAYAALAIESGMSLTEMSLRWSREREGLTSALVGHTSLEQLEQTLAAYTNPEALPEQLNWEIDCIHMRNRLPVFGSYRVGADAFGAGEIGERIP